jgi:glycosyltransferase involved in cell wall biosynthesis
MRVAVVLEDFSPDVGGGYTIQADIFKSLLDLAGESRHHFVAFCRRPKELRVESNSPIEAVAFPGGTMVRLASRVSRDLSRFQRNGTRQTRLEQVARDNQIDFMWFVGAEAIQVDLPYCAIVWDLQHRLQPWFPEVSSHGQWNHREAFYSSFLRRAALIITGTNAGSAEVEKFYGVPSERIKILPHPTPRFALNPQSVADSDVLSRYGLSPGYLFYPAQFWPHKNHANLLRAVADLRDQHELAFEVVLVGSDKGNQQHVRELANQLGLGRQVHFLGFVSQQDLAVLYQNAFALTYQSFFGPENLPPLEAFALGCPVIAANVAGAVEQLGDAAILVDPKNFQEIARAIRTLHNDRRLLAELVRRGRERASARTADQFVRGVFSFLDDFENIRHCWAG